jgi:exportin-2 (importin alpha re-exporter)
MFSVGPCNIWHNSFLPLTGKALPVLIADSIKYIMTFRSVLPREMVVGSIPQLVHHLTACNQVVHTYAACTIEKILVLRAADGSAM